MSYTYIGVKALFALSLISFALLVLDEIPIARVIAIVGIFVCAVGVGMDVWNLPRNQLKSNERKNN